jgi:hypothetical protein
LLPCFLPSFLCLINAHTAKGRGLKLRLKQNKSCGRRGSQRRATAAIPSGRRKAQLH